MSRTLRILEDVFEEVFGPWRSAGITPAEHVRIKAEIEGGARTVVLPPGVFLHDFTPAAPERPAPAGWDTLENVR